MKKILPIIGLVLLVGCGETKKKIDSMEVPKDEIVLVSIGCEPVMTDKKFYKLLASFVGKVDPSLLPKKTQEKLLSNWIQIELGVRAAMKEGLDSDSEFVKMHDEQAKQLRHNIVH